LAKVKNDEGKHVYTNLSLELWEKIYEKLFGGFEDLASTAIEDENEIDELENVPKEKKTKQGYLKDGFVIDSDGDDDDDDDDDDETEDDNSDNTSDIDENDELDGENIQEVGSELSEDIYDYSSDEVKK
jgi:ribonuclease E